MWILESKGDFFQGRRMWLKPGKQYLFGRAQKDGVRFALNHKTVSRKHFIIHVDDVQEADVGNAYARTKVTITDQGSKSGTSVNGERVKESRVLSNTENVIKLGTCAEELIIIWEPKILTWNLLKKEIKSGVLKTKHDRVRDLDIRAVSDYIPGTTTHCIANKRNTAKGLQCLVDAKHLVAESYIDALEYAATPADLNEDENLSPLEQDFDKAWPNEADHLPPAGREPTSRSAEFYQPDAARGSIFENFTFIFGDQTQYDTLLPPITTGHGKALLFKITDESTSVEDLVQYMQNAAGKKGFGDDKKDIDKGAVILVRWSSKDNEAWTNNLINQVALKIDQRAIEQGEFLDAILANNASSLRQAVPFESSSNRHVASALNNITTSSKPISSQIDRTRSQRETVPQAVERLRVVDAHTVPQDGVVRSTGGPSQERSATTTDSDDASQSFKPAFAFSARKKINQLEDFDDEFDEQAVIPYDGDDQEDDAMSTSASVNRQHTSPGPVTVMRDAKAVMHEQQPSKKRSRSSMEESANGDINANGDDLDDLLPAAAEMKRLKAANRRAVRQSPAMSQPSRGGVVLPKVKASDLKEVDVREELRTKREATRRLEEDEEDRPIEFDENGKLPVFDVKIDYVELPVRKRAVENDDAADTPRWDPKWNGRKNFKAFRRARDANGISDARRNVHARVIVPLVDARTTTYGMGDQYWDKTEEEKRRERERKRRASQRASQSQNSSNRTRTDIALDSDDENDGSRANNNTNNSDDDQPVLNGEDNDDAAQLPSPLSRLQEEAADITNHEVDVDEPRQTRSDGKKTQDPPHATGPSSRGTKRANTSLRGAAAKKQKTLPVQTVHGSDSESEDSDDMKFSFGRGRRGRRRGKALA